MTWTWTSRVNPPVSGRKTHPVARALRRGFERASRAWQNWSRGFSPSLSPFLSPLSPFHGEDFPPAFSASGWHWSPEWNMNETNETNETRKKGEWNKWNMNETRGQHDHRWRLSCGNWTLVSVSGNCDGCFDFHCRFPTSLSSSSLLCKNARGWPQWPGVAAEFVVVCEARKRLLSARTECEACIQIVSAACQHVVAIRTCPRHRNSAPADVFGASDLPPTTGDFLWVSGMCTVSPTCVSTESVSWCALMTSLTVVQITKLIFIHFHESKQAKAAHTNKLRMVKKRKEKTELRNEEKCTNQHKI